jgi:3-oxoacyl-[acyl-carrier protein] reductase
MVGLDSVTFVTASSTNLADEISREATSRVALVTGGGKGIGRAIADRLAGAGHRVAVTYRSGEVSRGVLGVRCDVTDPEQVESAFGEVEAALGPVDILVANAGITRDTLLMRMSDADWDAVIATNLTGAFRVAKRAARPMIKKRFGRIIFISSVVGLLGSAGQVNYAASKSGLVGMARSLARELGSRGITANVIAPGFIETAMTAELGEQLTTKYEAQIPLGRMGQVDDVANTTAFLASDGAGYITGALIPVDGGLGMGH